VDLMIALTYARAGDAAQAQKMADKPDRDWPLDTVIQDYWLPAIRASVELDRGDARKAIDLLQPATNYELGQPPQFQSGTMYPAYIRGLAYLRQGLSQEAAIEFQKLLDHRGILLTYPLEALARLGLARARAASGDKDAARKSYEELFAVWKDADPDLLLLKEARTSYVKIR